MTIVAIRLLDRAGRRVLLISEIYPVRVRASAMSAAACANWAANFVVTISFLTLLNAITDAGTFFMFAFLTVLALIYFWQRVPETKGLQLADISAGRGRPRPGPALVPAQSAARHAATPVRARRPTRL